MEEIVGNEKIEKKPDRIYLDIGALRRVSYLNKRSLFVKQGGKEEKLIKEIIDSIYQNHAKKSTFE